MLIYIIITIKIIITVTMMILNDDDKTADKGIILHRLRLRQTRKKMGNRNETIAK